MDSKNQQNQGQSAGQSASGSGTTGQDPVYGQQKGQFDARFSEEPHVIQDRLRAMGASAQDLLVIGKRQDGSPFAWSTGDQDATRELAKTAAPVLADLNS